MAQKQSTFVLPHSTAQQQNNIVSSRKKSSLSALPLRFLICFQNISAVFFPIIHKHGCRNEKKRRRGVMESSIKCRKIQDTWVITNNNTIAVCQVSLSFPAYAGRNKKRRGNKRKRDMNCQAFAIFIVPIFYCLSCFNAWVWGGFSC